MPTIPWKYLEFLNNWCLNNNFFFLFYSYFSNFHFPGVSDGKASVYKVGDLGREDLLEKEMATHSSILAWKIPWTEEPGRLQSIGSQRVGPD